MRRCRLIETARQWPEKLGTGKPYPEDIDERLENWLVYHCHISLNAPDEARRTLAKILAYQPGGQHKNHSGQIILALALEQSGRIAEAQSLVQALLRQDPGNKLVRWAASVLAGLPAPLPTGLQDINGRVLAALQKVRESRVADGFRPRQARSSESQVQAKNHGIGSLFVERINRQE